MSFRFYPGAVKKFDQAIEKALIATGHEVQDQVVEAQVMPFDIGTLQNESTFVDTSQSQYGQVSLVSSEPYARRLYFHPEYHFQTENNPHAKGKWLEDWAEEGKYAKDVKQAYAFFLKKYGGL
jgi:hypothetical protein